MTLVTERNAEAKRLVLEWLEKGKNFSPSEEVVEQLANAQQLLKELIPIKSKGFRGVVLTAIIGRELDPNFDPLINFYSCNPRSIFEQGIFFALQQEKIPCGKSDPLNVAKNIQKLDYDWAKGRRPEKAARAVVEYLKLLDLAQPNRSSYENLLLLYFHELYVYGQYVKALHVPMVAVGGDVPLAVGTKFAKFTTECPEGGSVPQYIVGNLLLHLREHDLRFSDVEGHEESVFGTNTTSKKPADVWEVLENGSTGALYEITVKKIDRKRLDDIVHTFESQGITDAVVTFICRYPEDTEGLQLKGPFLTHGPVRFQFVDIEEFVKVTYMLLSQEQQNQFRASIETFIGDVNRDIDTKKYWNKAFCGVTDAATVSQ